MKMPWETTADEIPALLRRDANNVAPFMLLTAYREKFPETAALWASPADNLPASAPSPRLPWEPTI